MVASTMGVTDVDTNTILHVLSILTTLTVLAGVLWRGSGFLTKVEITLDTQAKALIAHAADDATVFARHAADVGAMRDEVRRIAEALVTLAVQREQIAGIRIELSSLRAEITDLRQQMRAA